MNLSTYSKSIALFLVEVQLWGAFVVHSDPKPITATEWMMLAAVGVKTATVWLVPNTPSVSALRDVWNRHIATVPPPPFETASPPPPSPA